MRVSFRRENRQGMTTFPCMSVIKRSIGNISSPLTHIINLSITHGIVPDELKIARLVPIFKPGDKALFNNYRPISVLSCFSKFLERIIYNRIINYLNDFNVLCDNQYGFRKNRSPSLALIDLCDKISSAFDRREHAIGVFLDLSKASDTVNHVILFDKLEHYGSVQQMWNKIRSINFVGQQILTRV